MSRFFNSLRDGVGFDLVLVGAALLFLLALAGLPLLYNVLMSFQQVDMFTLGTLIRPWAGFTNYVDVVRQPEFWLVARNTLIFVFASMAGQFVIGFSLALFFAQKFPGAATIRGLFLVSWVMPGLVVGAIWSWILAGDFGVLNTILKSLGIIQETVFWKSDPNYSIWAVVIANIWLGTAFNMLLLAVGLAAIPRDLYEAAELDGANAFQRFWTITLPMMRSTIGAVLSLGLIGTLQQFDLFPAITEGGPANTSSVAGYWSWQMSFQLYDFAKGATISVMMFLLVLFASVIYVRSTRHEVRG
ncbi:MAG: sugar ABC transporter permease [Alphaproteobacteria bacterium]|jgi:multiple sugar transport system permease protein|uniref:carbohydrate ABC transporter permease n=1 Tax=Devosia sp. XGJD_8 TaxID=3391187 RepID=UPI001D36DAEC|nr:sugar ABC transporter permease [Alphaproteobacteria bacterium]MBU1560694.1 sugar ABC transporter permease [Alphaproteobacteria bacterium]MBU2301922.1 sugar ABC transporter permease [Alphaproteobacteria bacterium]MBU2368972.1 sugar ABC transporter permease [Alphaproteobacteria bacterium]